MHKSFTMAEVLITLGIIGIVAAMTLPALVSEHKKKTVEARLKKFYSVANQAILQSELKNGPKEYWARCGDGIPKPNSSTMLCEDWYNLYLRDYLNTVYVEHFLNNYQNTAAYFADGSLMVIKSGYDIFFYPFAKDFDKEDFFHVSEDGTTSRPDAGKKFFAFTFVANMQSSSTSLNKGKGIEPYKSLICKEEIQPDGSKKVVCNNLTRDELLNNPNYGCNKNSPYKAYCTALIQENNWEIPDDYPFRF